MTKLKRKIRETIERTLNLPIEELGRFARFVRFQIQMWKFCARRLVANNASAMAADLSYRTIFALVPALVLGLILAQAFHVLDDSKRSVRAVLDVAGFNRVLIDQYHEADGGPFVSLPEGAATSRRHGVVETEAGISDSGETAAEADDGQPPPASVGSAPEERPMTATDLIIEVVDSVEKKLTFGRIGPLGILVLVYATLRLLYTLEQSLNRVFEAQRGRRFMKRIFLYWAAVTMVPLLLAVGSVLRRSAGKALAEVAVPRAIASMGAWVVGFVISWFVLATVYTFVPTGRTRFHGSLGGALVALPLWEIVKWGFAIYVRKFVSTGSVYGTLGLLPLFLIWLYLSWLIFLFGAQIAHTLANFTRMALAERAQRITLGPSEMLAGAIAVARGNMTHGGPVTFDEIVNQLGLPDPSVAKIMDHLANLGVVCPAESPETGRSVGYLPARPLDRIPVLEIMEVAPGKDAGASATRPADEALAATLDETRRRISTATGRYTLADVVGRSAATPPGRETV